MNRRQVYNKLFRFTQNKKTSCFVRVFRIAKPILVETTFMNYDYETQHCFA